MRRSSKLSIESLESRALMSGGPPTPVGISMDNYGTLTFKGDERAETATVWVANSVVHAAMYHTTYKNIGGSVVPLTTWEPEKSYPVAQVKHISFFGADGNDSFTNNTSIESLAAGGDGNDELIGGFGNDTMNGGDGSDTLEGRAGNDELRGGAGSDTFAFKASFVGLGSDTIIENANADADTLDFKTLNKITVDLASEAAQAVKNNVLTLTLSDGLGIENVEGTNGADTILGNNRANVIHGRSGNDFITGEGGSDYLYGDNGHDTLRGDAGNNSLYGGAGNDTLTAGNNSNFISDGLGNDYIDFQGNGVGVTFTTGGGNDTVLGSSYNDVITGSSGNDSIVGASGNDVLKGGLGNDTLLGGAGNNSISDGGGNDLIDFRGNGAAINFTTGGGNDEVYGTSWNDKIVGSSGKDTLHGWAGNDRLFGKGGVDHLFGDDGDDWLEAGSAAEVADGGTGTDYNAHKWAINGATYDDVKQGQIGTCVFLSALSGAAQQGINLAGRITYLGDYHYRVKLYNADTGAVHYEQVTFDGCKSDVDPGMAQSGEFWTTLYQRAYLEMTAKMDVNFKDPDYAMFALTKREVDSGDWSDPTVVKNALAAGKVITAGNADETNQVFANHSYTVMSVTKVNGTWWITLRNPWGYDGGSNTWGDPNDGVITMTWNSFQGYNDFDRISIS